MNLTPHDSVLQYAVQRIIKLESLLIPVVPETVWPVEVNMILGQIEGAKQLPEHHQRRLRHHINRMWLDPPQLLPSCWASHNNAYSNGLRIQHGGGQQSLPF